MSRAASAVILLGALGVACGSKSAGSPASSSGGQGSCAGCAQAGASGSADVAGEGGSPANTEGGAAGAESAGAPGSGGEAGAQGEAGAAGEAGAPPSAPDVAMSEVSLWQAMRVPLEMAGAEASPNAPLITGKPGILRVFVQPGPSFRSRSLEVALELDGRANASTSAKVILGPSQNGDFGTTFNFPLEGADVFPARSYSVTLRDSESGASLDRYPRLGTAALATLSATPALKVTIVPLVVAGRTPDTSPAMLAKFRTRVLSMYPLADLTFSIHEPLVSTVPVGPDAGWDQTLDELYALRAQDAPPDDVYYFGLFTPTATFADYCVTDCTVGLSQIAGAQEVEYRGAIGLDVFSDGSNSDAPDTMAHELGHALGREHSPCMISDPTGLYPYAGGKIGTWGFDSVNHQLLDPALYGDVMGYCTPDWISDYTYGALFDRIRYVYGNVAAEVRVRAARVAYRRVLVDARGALHWGARSMPTHPTSGQPLAVVLLDVTGAEVGNVAGYYRALSDGRHGFLLVPEAALDANAGVAAIRVGSAELSLDMLTP